MLFLGCLEKCLQIKHIIIFYQKSQVVLLILSMYKIHIGPKLHDYLSQIYSIVQTF